MPAGHLHRRLWGGSVGFNALALSLGGTAHWPLNDPTITVNTPGDVDELLGGSTDKDEFKTNTHMSYVAASDNLVTGGSGNSTKMTYPANLHDGYTAAGVQLGGFSDNPGNQKATIVWWMKWDRTANASGTFRDVFGCINNGNTFEVSNHEQSNQWYLVNAASAPANSLGVLTKNVNIFFTIRYGGGSTQSARVYDPVLGTKTATRTSGNKGQWNGNSDTTRIILNMPKGTTPEANELWVQDAWLFSGVELTDAQLDSLYNAGK